MAARSRLDPMTGQRLRSIEVAGYKSIKDTEVRLGDLNVLVGANGAGKSNLISAVEMLGRMMERELNRFVDLNGGASTLLHGGTKGGMPIGLRLDFNGGGYAAQLLPADDDGLAFVSETALTPPSAAEGGSLLPFSVSGSHRESRLPAIYAREIHASISVYELTKLVVEILRSCRVYHFHDTSSGAPVKRTGYTADNLTLQPDAGNLAAVLLRLQEDEPVAYRRIVRTIQQVAPFFRDFVLVERNERIQLRWKQEGSDTVFPASALSDGTLRFICLTTLLTMPDRPHLLVLDEPELGLHPYAIVQLAEMLRAASRESQVLIATQSVTLMNQFELDDLIVVERSGGASVFTRPDPEQLHDWLEEYSLGDLWEKNLLGGRPRTERG